MNRTVTLEAGEFAYREAGPPDGTPAVMLHGLGSKAATWDRIATGLAGRGYRAPALDQRGHGDSARTAGYSFEPLRDDVAGFADALRLGQFVLNGHSMGGTAACHVPQDLLAEAAARIPGSRLVTVDGAGHHLDREHPAEFLAHVTAFLAGQR
ncbi:MAG: alpha/beta fold hydrolase [Mycobacteriales bacterium]